MICSKNFWDTVICLISKLENESKVQVYEAIVINFGNWESAMRMNPSLSSCHPHAHIWLTPVYIDYIAKKYTKFGENFYILADHVGEPENYTLQNANELEQNRIQSLRYNRLESRMEKLESEIADIKQIQSQILDLLTKQITK